MTRPRPRLLAALVLLVSGLLLVTDLPSTARPTQAPVAAARAADPAFRVATFNLLGASHTKKGRKAKMGSGKTRMARSVKILHRRDIGLVGFQEMQPSQVAEFLRLRSRTWGLYPGTALRQLDGENSIGWRKDTWKLLSASTIPIPYFNGNIRNMPVLLMHHKPSGRRVYIIDVHNPATNRHVGNQDKWRAVALARETSFVNRLRTTTHLPVLLVGDFNDRELAFCPLFRDTSLRAANGGSATSTTCSMPRPAPVDWVFGSIGVHFSSYRKLETKFVQRTTDHPVVFADVELAAPSSIIAP